MPASAFLLFLKPLSALADAKSGDSHSSEDAGTVSTGIASSSSVLQ